MRCGVGEMQLSRDKLQGHLEVWIDFEVDPYSEECGILIDLYQRKEPVEMLLSEWGYTGPAIVTEYGMTAWSPEDVVACFRIEGVK